MSQRNVGSFTSINAFPPSNTTSSRSPRSPSRRSTNGTPSPQFRTSSTYDNSSKEGGVLKEGGKSKGPTNIRDQINDLTKNINQYRREVSEIQKYNSLNLMTSMATLALIHQLVPTIDRIEKRLDKLESVIISNPLTFASTNSSNGSNGSNGSKDPLIDFK